MRIYIFLNVNGKSSENHEYFIFIKILSRKVWRYHRMISCINGRTDNSMTKTKRQPPQATNVTVTNDWTTRIPLKMKVHNRKNWSYLFCRSCFLNRQSLSISRCKSKLETVPVLSVLFFISDSMGYEIKIVARFGITSWKNIIYTAEREIKRPG